MSLCLASSFQARPIVFSVRGATGASKLSIPRRFFVNTNVSSNELSEDFPEVDGRPFLGLVRRYGVLDQPERVPGISCRDPEDLKFIECLLHSGANCLVTGDKDVLDVKLKTASILTPRQFCDRYFSYP
jgi:predicted nucleic acid-binding protein